MPKEVWPYKEGNNVNAENGGNYIIRISRDGAEPAGVARPADNNMPMPNAEYSGCLTTGKVAIDFPAVWIRRAAYHMPPQKSIYYPDNTPDTDKKTDAEKDFDQKKSEASPGDQNNFHFYKKYWYELETVGAPGTPRPLTNIELKPGENYIVIEMQPCLLRREKGQAVRDSAKKLWADTHTEYALPDTDFTDPHGSIQVKRKIVTDRLTFLGTQQQTPAVQQETTRLGDELDKYDRAVTKARTRCPRAGDGARSAAQPPQQPPAPSGVAPYGGDCSGTTWVSYKDAGVGDYGYMTTRKFLARLQGNPHPHPPLNPTIDLTFPFKEVDLDDAQPGDIYLFRHNSGGGHVGINDSGSGTTARMLTAHDIRGEYENGHLSLYDKVYSDNQSLSGYGILTAVLRYYGCITGS